ncbi:MAG: thioesterase [Candidatus Micrarchaeota archaeon]|nr:MAG: thioesterase [Candidatus Micrarchaeota archaeon]
MFSYEERVKIYDTDAQGILHYAGYYRFFTDAIENAARKLNISFPFYTDKLWFVVVESHANYLRSVYLNDLLHIDVDLSVNDNKKALRSDLTIYDKTRGGYIACKGYLVHLLINKEIWKSVELPEEIIELIKRSKDS